MKLFMMIFVLLLTFSLTFVAESSAKLKCNMPQTYKINAEYSVSSGSTEGVETVKRISKTQSLVITREYGLGTFNTVTFWLKDESSSESAFYSLGQFEMGGDYLPDFTFQNSVLLVKGGIVDNLHDPNTGLYAPTESGVFETTIHIGSIEPGFLQLTTQNCQL